VAEHGTIEAVLDAYRAAVYAKDVDALVGLYDDDVRVFDLWDAWSHDGADAWRRVATAWFRSLGGECVVVEFQDVKTVSGDGFAIAHAFVTYKGISPEGEELRAMTNRLSWALRKRNDAWRIVHEHTSAPADAETATVRLRR
jgi:uncharacterized protein (TIGR02246 family)